MTSELVFLVEDTEAVRRSLASQIEGFGYEVRSFPSATTFLDHYKPVANSCLLLDVRMPGMSGVELQAQLKENNDPTPVIMISGHADVPTAVRSMKNGAVDFLSKPIRTEELEASIRFALSNGDASRLRVDVSHEEIDARISRLTPRESEVLTHVVDGMSSRQIAEELEVSFKTIEAHRAKIMTKTKARNVAHLVRLCLT